MPQYFFTIRVGDQSTPKECAVELSDDGAAFAHACEIVQELTQSLSGTHRSSLVEVGDETRPRVFSIPFFPACA
jgi:hypothetical protein